MTGRAERLGLDAGFRHEVYAEADLILAQPHPGIRGKLASQIRRGTKSQTPGSRGTT